MRCVVQRVTHAGVTVNGETVGAIGAGFAVLLGVEAGDTAQDARYMAGKLAGLRVFEDAEGKMNLSILDAFEAPEMLVVSQFTLLADTRGGKRPSFIKAARPEEAEPLCEQVCGLLREMGVRVETGRFRTEMRVALTNDGPVTILIDSRKTF